MIYSIKPNLTDAERHLLEEFILDALGAEEYSTYPRTAVVNTIINKLCLWRDNKRLTLSFYDYWYVDGTTLRMGRSPKFTTVDFYLPMKDRLMVLITLSGYLGERSAELEAAIKKATLKHLYGEYQEVRKAALIEAEVPQEGMAVNTKDAQVAFLMAGEWMLPNGETVDVTTEDWEVYANTFPAVETPEATSVTAIETAFVAALKEIGIDA